MRMGSSCLSQRSTVFELRQNLHYGGQLRAKKPFHFIILLLSQCVSLYETNFQMTSTEEMLLLFTNAKLLQLSHQFTGCPEFFHKTLITKNTRRNSASTEKINYSLHLNFKDCSVIFNRFLLK